MHFKNGASKHLEEWPAAFKAINSLNAELCPPKCRDYKLSHTTRMSTAMYTKPEITNFHLFI